MRDEDYAKLLDDTQRELIAGAGPAAVLGLTPVTLRLLASLTRAGLDRAVRAVYAPGEGEGCSRSGSSLPGPWRACSRRSRGAASSSC